MTTPAFEVARHIGNNLSGAFNKVKDENVIESILSQAVQSGDPEVLQDSIGKILSKVSPERQGAAIKYLEGSYNRILEKQQMSRQRVAAKEAGVSPDLPPQLQAQQYKENAKTQRINQAYPSSPQTVAQGASVPSAPTNPVENQPPSLDSINKKKQELIALTGHPDLEVRERAKAELKEIQAQEKINQKSTQQLRDEEIQFHKESEKYDEELLKQSKTAKNQIETISNIEKALASGNVKPSSLANIFKGFGKIGDKISEALINSDEATLLASIPQLLEGWKDVFGVRLSDADLRLLQDKLPSIGKSPDANKSIVKVLKKYADMTSLRGKIGREIKEGNKGLRPLGYADKIEARFDEMVSPVKIVNPNNGNVIEVPAYKVSEAIQAGGKLVNEQL